MALFATASAWGQNNWTMERQSVTREHLWGVAYNGSALIAVGENGTILYSDYEGAAWQRREAGVSEWLLGIASRGDRWIAVGDRGSILVSDDNGDTWSRRTSGTTLRLNAVAYGNGVWVAIGEQGAIVVSRNGGEAWTATQLPDAGFLRALAYGRGLFLIGGARGALYSSVDGTAFTRVPIVTTDDIEAAAITSGRFFLGGSNGLLASGTELGTWSDFRSSSANGTFRAVVARNDNDASALSESASALFYDRLWNDTSFRPSFLPTAIALAKDEAIAVGFGGAIARSSSLYGVAIQPARARVTYGAEFRLTAVPTGPATDVTYQWQWNGADIPGATRAELVFPSVRPGDGGNYGVRARSVAGAIVPSSEATFVVMPGGAANNVDPSFKFPFSRGPFALAFQADGKLLATGPYGAVPTESAVVRLLPDGSVDPSFRIRPGVSRIVAMADGRSYYTGLFSQLDGEPRAGLARVLPDDSLDRGFVPDSRLGTPTLVAVSPDGRAYVSTSDRAIVRLTDTGRRDETFTPISSLYSIEGFDSVGRIIASQRFSPTLIWTFPGVVHRFAINGVRDTSFLYDLTNAHLAKVVGEQVYGSRQSYGKLGTANTYFARSTDPSFRYVGGAPTTLYPDSGRWFAMYRANGSVWDFRRPTGELWKATLYSPTGEPDLSHYLQLPYGTDRPLAVAPDGALYMQGGPVLRLRPIVGRVGRLTNLSVRAFVSDANAPLVAGFVTAGEGETRALVRGVGPALSALGVTDAMPDPQLSLVRDGLVQIANDNWNPALASRFAAIGAFPLASGGRDAALESPIIGGLHSAVVGPTPGSSGGTVLVELYESSEDFGPRRFVNVSARGPVAPGRPLIVGFTISGEHPLGVLIRGIGPTLASFGVLEAVPDVKLTLFSGNTALYENNDWATHNPTLTTSTAGTGAFPLPASSRDAAFHASLAPGGYTAVLETSDTRGGTALIEIFETP